MTQFPAGTFAPSLTPGRRSRMLLEHAKTETKLTLRHGEQVLLTLLIPLALLIGLSLLDIVKPAAGEQLSKVDWVTPRILALAVMSSAFTGQAIALGFDRRYGVVKRLFATAFPLWLLVAGRLAAVLTVVAVQTLILGGVAALLGWSPSSSGLALAIIVLAVGTLSFGALGVLLGGALRAEAVLAIANIVWFALLLAGGIIWAPSTLPGGLAAAVSMLPSGALAEGLRSALITGSFDVHAIAILLAWAVGAGLLASRTTKLT